MRLPGTEEWSEAALSARISFERNVAGGAIGLLTETAASNNFENPDEVGKFLPSDAIFAFGRAAELSFAAGEFDRGIKICEELFTNEQIVPKTPMQLVFQVTIGALLGLLRISWDFKGAFALSFVGEQRVRIDWPSESMSHTILLMHLLLPVAVVSGSGNAVNEILLGDAGQQVLSPRILSAVRATSEYAALFGDSPTRAERSKIEGLLNLEANYSRRMALMRSDYYYWKTLRPRGAIIDWSLLSCWVAVLRFRREGLSILDQVPSLDSESAFVRTLAKDFLERLNR